VALPLFKRVLSHSLHNSKSTTLYHCITHGTDVLSTCALASRECMLRSCRRLTLMITTEVLRNHRCRLAVVFFSNNHRAGCSSRSVAPKTQGLALNRHRTSTFGERANKKPSPRLLVAWFVFHRSFVRSLLLRRRFVSFVCAYVVVRQPANGNSPPPYPHIPTNHSQAMPSIAHGRGFSSQSTVQ